MRQTEKIKGSGEFAVVPGQQIEVAHDAAPVCSPSSAQGGDVNIELLKEGDVIQAIDVVCACGRRIRVRCVYDR